MSSSITRVKSGKIRKRKKKTKDLITPLSFIEEPYNGTRPYLDESVYGEPIEFPTTKLLPGQLSNWVSPQITNTCKKKTRSCMSLRERKTKEVKLLKLQNDNLSTSIAISEDITPKKVCRNTDEPFVGMNMSTPDVCNNFGSNVSTPRMDSNLSVNTEQTPIHYLFQGRTPLLRNFVILVEDTPM